MAITIQEYGDQLMLVINDVKYLAVPTPGGLWIVNTNSTPDPEPGTGDWSWPFDPRPSSSGGAVSPGGEYGVRDVTRFHQGLDFGYGKAQSGAAIYNTNAGIVQDTGFSGGGFGHYVTMHHGTFGDYDVKTIYAHMISTPAVTIGQTVPKGEVLGAVGNTGASFGAHLHWETHLCAIGGDIITNIQNNSNPRTAVNPRDFMATYGDGAILNE